jgi:hypothetical protein
MTAINLFFPFPCSTNYYLQLNMHKPFSTVTFLFSSGRRITQEHRRRLSIAKQNAESIAMITKDLEKEFCAV